MRREHRFQVDLPLLRPVAVLLGLHELFRQLRGVPGNPQREDGTALGGVLRGDLAADYVMRYENLGDELAMLARIIGCDPSAIALPHAKPRRVDKLESLGYRVAKYVYEPGTVFPDHKHEVDKIDAVISGRFRLVVRGHMK